MQLAVAVVGLSLLAGACSDGLEPLASEPSARPASPTATSTPNVLTPTNTPTATAVATPMPTPAPAKQPSDVFDACPTGDRSVCEFAMEVEGMLIRGAWDEFMEQFQTYSVSCPQEPYGNACEHSSAATAEAYAWGGIEWGLFNAEYTSAQLRRFGGAAVDTTDGAGPSGWRLYGVGGPPLFEYLHPNCSRCPVMLYSRITVAAYLGRTEVTAYTRELLLVGAVKDAADAWHIDGFLHAPYPAFSGPFSGGAVYKRAFELWNPREGRGTAPGHFVFGEHFTVRSTRCVTPDFPSPGVAGPGDATGCLANRDTVILAGGPVAEAGQIWRYVFREFSRPGEVTRVEGWVPDSLLVP